MQGAWGDGFVHRSPVALVLPQADANGECMSSEVAAVWVVFGYHEDLDNQLDA
jgi:hypothetical protein